jgi:hypothetical protein
MPQRPRILLQLDGDAQPSVFDAVVAADCGVEHLLRHGNVQPEGVAELVHGAIFTRSPGELNHTAIFVGGSDVEQAEAIAEAVQGTFFGPMRVSVMSDANGANTTAAAAVLTAAKHVELDKAAALVLAATGPVGRRAVQLLAALGATVHVASRRLDRAEQVCRAVEGEMPGAKLTAVATGTEAQLAAACEGVQVVIAAGAAGVELMPEAAWKACASLRVAIDLNAVAPAGIEGIAPDDAGSQRDAVACYGAIGVGGLKMKIHKAAIRQLFESNDRVLDCPAIFEIGKSLADG